MLWLSRWQIKRTARKFQMRMCQLNLNSQKYKSKNTTRLSWRDCQRIIYSMSATGENSFLRLSAGCAVTSESGRAAEGKEQSTSRGNL